MKRAKILFAIISITLGGCVGKTNENGINQTSSYEVLGSLVEKWQIWPPSRVRGESTNEAKEPLFKVKFYRDEGTKAANLCKNQRTQSAFDDCVVKAYLEFDIQPLNLANYIESEVYVKFRDHPQLRRLINEAKKDKKVSNGEFGKIIEKSQELLTWDYEKQYSDNISRL